MCLLIDATGIDLGWGCCRCKTYNRIGRDLCKHCGEPHHPIPDGEGFLDARAEQVNPEEAEGCPHEPACPRCQPGGANPCPACGRDMALDITLRHYIVDGRIVASTHARCVVKVCAVCLGVDRHWTVPHVFKRLKDGWRGWVSGGK